MFNNIAVTVPLPTAMCLSCNSARVPNLMFLFIFSCIYCYGKSTTPDFNMTFPNFPTLEVDN